jgi:hypothetical protein
MTLASTDNTDVNFDVVAAEASRMLYMTTAVATTSLLLAATDAAV